MVVVVMAIMVGEEVMVAATDMVPGIEIMAILMEGIIKTTIPMHNSLFLVHHQSIMELLPIVRYMESPHIPLSSVLTALITLTN